MSNLPARSPLPWKWLLPVSLVPALVACLQLGRVHPDEVYQWLEPAFYKAHGYGVMSWEWTTGLRNWLVPGFFALLLKGCQALHLTHPLAYRAALELPQWALHLASLVAVYRFAERRGGHDMARWAIVLMGLSGPVVAFAGRTLGESFSTSFLLLAVEKLDEKPEKFTAGLWAGVFLGAAVVVRYPSAVMVLACLLWLLWARRWALLSGVVAGGAAMAFVLGGLDWATWGRPFHSLIAYVDFNVLSGEAQRRFGEEGAHFYFLPLIIYAPLWGIVSLLRRKVSGLPFFIALTYLFFISLTPHKEIRFLYPGLVLVGLSLVSGVGARLGLWPMLATALSFLPWFFDAGLSAQRPQQFQAIVRATRGDDVRGLLVVNEGLWGAGGYFYIGKNIPWVTCDWPTEARFRQAMKDMRINRAVTWEDRGLKELQAEGFSIVEKRGPATWLAR